MNAIKQTTKIFQPVCQYQSLRLGILLLVSAFCVPIAYPQKASDGASTPRPPPIDVLIPIEVLAPKPDWVGEVQISKGIRWDSAIIASQPARPARGIVLSEVIGPRPMDVTLHMAILGKLQLDSKGAVMLDLPSNQVVWCRDASGNNVSSRCYQDSDNDGKLDLAAYAYLPRSDALSANRIDALAAIAPIAYRPAHPEELLELNLEYASCRDAEGKLFYAHRIRRVKKPILLGAVTNSGCTEIATPIDTGNSSQKQYQVGRMKIAMFEEGDKLKTRVTEGIPTGTILGHLRVDRPFTDAVNCRSAHEERSAHWGNARKLSFVGKPTVAVGPVKPGEMLFSGEVIHGITGRLVTPIVTGGTFTGKVKELHPAGTAVYGVLMNKTLANRNLDPDIVWCMPRDKNSTTRKYPECIVSDSGLFRLAWTSLNFNVDTLSVSSSASIVSAPIVERGPVDFGGPVQLEVRFGQWKKKIAEVQVAYDLLSETAKTYERLQLPRGDGGSVWLFIGDKKYVEIKPADDGVAAVLIDTDTHALRADEDADVKSTQAVMHVDKSAK